MREWMEDTVYSLGGAVFLILVGLWLLGKV